MPRLRVLAGTSLERDKLVPITSIVNRNQPHALSSDLFDGQVVVNIKGLNEGGGDGEYFEREDRKGITWSIQVQGRFLKNFSSNDILFGNTFDRPLNLPWGSGAALSFMKYIDPTLEHDLLSQSKPWALSPLISTMPHLSHTRLRLSSRGSSSSFSSGESGVADVPTFPPKVSLTDDTSHLHHAFVRRDESDPSPSSSSSSLSSRKSGSSVFSSQSKKKRRVKNDCQDLKFSSATERRAYFANEENRNSLVLGPNDIIQTDFCYGFIHFSPTLSLRLPAGISFDLMRYWDGQPVRFVCCERKRNGDNEPWGKIFWCVVIELVNDMEDES